MSLENKAYPKCVGVIYIYYEKVVLLETWIKQIKLLLETTVENVLLKQLGSSFYIYYIQHFASLKLAGVGDTSIFCSPLVQTFDGSPWAAVQLRCAE